MGREDDSACVYLMLSIICLNNQTYGSEVMYHAWTSNDGAEVYFFMLSTFQLWIHIFG